MNKAFQLLWTRPSFLGLRPFNNCQNFAYTQFQTSQKSKLGLFSFSYEHNKRPPRVWEGGDRSSFKQRDRENHQQPQDNHQEPQDNRGSNESSEYRQNRHYRSDNDYADSQGQNRDYQRNRPSYSSYGENRGQQSRGFTQPVQTDTPEIIQKDILNQYKQGENPPHHNRDFNEQQKVNIKKNNGSSKDEDYLFNFDALNLPNEIKEVLIRENFLTPSPIQSVAIPYVLRGDDMINLAQTGSGKTLAFVIPAILHIMNQPLTRFPRILVLAPTRELAMQIQSQFDLFSNIIMSTCVYGGHPKSVQQRRLSYKNDVIIATPGRLLDFLQDGYPLSTITQVVLDEADRMLDMGFEPQIRDILKKVRKDKQTLFFSATWPREVQQLAQDLCSQNPNIIRIGSDGMTLNKDINQSVTIVSFREKSSKFMEIINGYKDSQKKVLVFCSRKIDTQKVEDMVNSIGMSATSLHGDLTQRDRDYRMKQFRSGDAQVMIATNLASRGLDIQDIELVVNYDFPDSIEDYIHRIGRTGRAGRTGNAITIIPQNMSKKKLLLDLIKVLKQTNQQVSTQLQNLAYN